MQTKMKVHKYKKASIALLAFTVAALFLALLFGTLPSGISAIAADNSSGPVINYEEDCNMTVVLDINGGSADLTSAEGVNTGDGDVGSFGTNRFLRSRYISISALYSLSSEETTAGYRKSDFYLANDSAIYNYTEDYFTISLLSTNASQNGYTNLVITAVKPTADLKSNPRFALELTGINDNAGKKLHLQVIVQVLATAPRGVASGDSLYVGDRLNASQTAAVEKNPNDDTFPIVLENYSEVEINLREYVLGRKLYKKQPVSANHSYDVSADNGVEENKAEPVKNNYTSTGGAQSEYVAFNYFGNYAVSQNTQMRINGNPWTGVDFYTDDSLSFILSVNLSSGDIATMREMSPSGNFWQNEGEIGTFFELSVRIETSIENYVVLNLPVVFVPSDEPKVLSSYEWSSSLNVSSDTVDIEHNGDNVDGYNRVRIRPEDICDYPTYDGFGLYFLQTVKPSSTSACIRITDLIQDEEKGISYYEVYAVENGSANITFTVAYKPYDKDKNPSEVTPSRKEIEIPFTAYGGYSLNFEIRGTRQVDFDIGSSVFSLPQYDGYQLKGAQVLSIADGYIAGDYCSVGYQNGIITVTPRKSVDPGYIGIQVTMVNMDGNQIILKGQMSINLDANDVFFGWALWQIILFWIGIGVAALLVILFIVWLFIRSIHKRKIDELETSAPTSAYIIKLNSTIAAAQAQQKLASQQQSYGQPNGQLLQLGAAPGQAAANPNTLALGSMPQNSMPQMSMGATQQMSMGATQQMSSGMTMPQTGAPTFSMGSTYGQDNVATAPRTEEIIIPISDEDLLQRIYEEKFEPRGMLKRTFDKSKDLQQRELEKEKERIREDVRGGMSIEEACKSLKQREAEAAAYGTTQQQTAEQEPQVDPILALLGFDPADPIVAQVEKGEIAEDASAEEKKLKEAEYNNARLRAELAIIEERVSAIDSANAKLDGDIAAANDAIEDLSFGIKETEQKLDDKNTDLAVERRKSAKEALNKEIAELEAKIRTDKDTVAARKNEIETNNGLLARIKELGSEYAGKKEATDALVAASDAELEAARAEAQKAADLAAKAKRQAQLAAQLEVLNPMMQSVNGLDDEIKQIEIAIESSGAEKDMRKTAVAALQNELMSTTDPAKITEISARIKDINKEISDLDRAATANTTLKTNKGIELSAVRRKANEFIDKEDMAVEDIITAEDLIIGQIALDKLLKQVEKDKSSAEEQVAHWQATCDSLIENLDSTVLDAASGVAERVKQAEEALADAQNRLNEVNLKLELSESDDEKLELTMEQTTLGEEVEKLTAEFEAVRAEGIKSNLETRTQGEAEIENARQELAKAKEDFESATARFHEVSTSVNPLDLITSGSGIISQDRKKIEAENLKKLLEEQKNAIEQAKLQAQIAQQEAEKAVADAQRASEESKAEAERLAQEALARAEEAREEAERARKEAAEEAERARAEAMEEAEKAKQEAAEEAERARQEAAEAAERARQEAEEARKKAEEEAEAARKAAEEEAERIRLENEESKRLAEEEAEKARLAAEEEARKAAEEEAEKARKAAEEEAKNKARIDEKIAKRKAEIATLREELKNVTEEEQGNALREKFYAMQLALDEDEKSSTELSDLLAKSMDDASHAAELSRYKKLANQKPRRIVKKVTERINRIPKKTGAARPGARPGAARSGAARPGARPAAARPGARPAARPGARPAAARPGARPAARPGARPTRPGARPSGTRPTNRGPAKK